MGQAPEAELIEAAVRLFGLTDNPRECGYVMPDGRMLDLSGRHYDGSYQRRGFRNVAKRGPDYHAGGRVVDHRELGDLVEAGGTDGMLEFMARSGAVRVMPGQGFTVMLEPTARQIALMCLFARFYREEVHVEVYDRQGDVISHGSFENLSPRDVVAVLQEGGLAITLAPSPGP